jgi:hypothetical protein
MTRCVKNVESIDLGTSVNQKLFPVNLSHESLISFQKREELKHVSG